MASCLLFPLAIHSNGFLNMELAKDANYPLDCHCETFFAYCTSFDLVYIFRITVSIFRLLWSIAVLAISLKSIF